MFMDTFIRIVTTGNTAPLTAEQWDIILTEYLTASQSKAAKRALNYQREIVSLTNEIYLTRLLIAAIDTNHSEELTTRLRNRGYRMPFTTASWEADRNMVLLQLKSKELRISQLRTELSEDEEKGSPPTEADYLRQLNDIAKHEKHVIIRARDITVAEYCAKLVRFTEDMEYLVKVNNGR